MAKFEGSWISGETAGGCRNYLDSFASNPQFRITVEDPDEDDDDNLCTAIVSLMQKGRRSSREVVKVKIAVPLFECEKLQYFACFLRFFAKKLAL